MLLGFQVNFLKDANDTTTTTTTEEETARESRNRKQSHRKQQKRRLLSSEKTSGDSTLPRAASRRSASCRRSNDAMIASMTSRPMTAYNIMSMSMIGMLQSLRPNYSCQLGHYQS